MVLGYIGPQSVFEGPQSVFEGPYKDLRVCFEGPQNVSWRARTQNVDLKDLRMCSGVACTPDKQIMATLAAAHISCVTAETVSPLRFQVRAVIMLQEQECWQRWKRISNGLVIAVAFAGSFTIQP